MSFRNNASLVIRNLETNNIKNCIFHTDHGVQYSCYEYLNYSKIFGIERSMSDPGNSLQNSPIEYFWSNLKEECINLIPYKERTMQRIEYEIKKHISFYNKKRRQTCLMNLSPSKYKQDLLM